MREPPTPTTDPPDKARKNVHFVLVEPEEPGNIGAAARALKTMGFEKLILVNPPLKDTPEARRMAHRSYDIIEKAPVFSTLEEAIKDMRLTVGTTTRRRRFDFPLLTPREAGVRLSRVAVEHPVAIVFGRERTGLTNEELYRCQLHSTAPTATRNPSLNLAQAVMIYSYTIFSAMNEKVNVRRLEPASQEELERLYERLSRLLGSVGFVPHDGIENFIVRFKRLVGRSTPERRDVRMLHKLLQILAPRGISEKRG